MSEDARAGESQPDSGLKRFYTLLGVVAAVGLGLVGYVVTLGGSRGPSSVPLDLEGLDDPEALVAMARGVTKGDPNAAITILEFGDYQCPGCGQFARDYKPAIELELIGTGRAKFIFHDYPLVNAHPHAFLAARAARCAEDQGMFWEYHDHLFREQAYWSPMTEPVDMFEDYAAELGLDRGEFAGCLNSDRHADLVTANLRLAELVGVPRTPTILVNVGGAATREADGWDVASIEETIALLSAPAETN